MSPHMMCLRPKLFFLVLLGIDMESGIFLSFIKSIASATILLCFFPNRTNMENSLNQIILEKKITSLPPVREGYDILGSKKTGWVDSSDKNQENKDNISSEPPENEKSSNSPEDEENDSDSEINILSKQNQRGYKKGRNQKNKQEFDPVFLPRVVDYETEYEPGSIMIDTSKRFLYLIEEGGKARRYGVAVGRKNMTWAGTERVSRKAEWPDWRPPAEMIIRESKKGKRLPAFVRGGPDNPLGARAIYLGSTLYRIHGTNAPWTIGQEVSSGCIRMRNQDVEDLYQRVKIGAQVVVM